jgi:hypothetical protein
VSSGGTLPSFAAGVLHATRATSVVGSARRITRVVAEGRGGNKFTDCNRRRVHIARMLTPARLGTPSKRLRANRSLHAHAVFAHVSEVRDLLRRTKRRARMPKARYGSNVDARPRSPRGFHGRTIQPRRRFRDRKRPRPVEMRRHRTTEDGAPHRPPRRPSYRGPPWQGEVQSPTP